MAEAVMSPAELELRAKLRDDFTFYAPKSLKIRAKDGQIVPLALNKAQLYIHFRLEEQKAQTGMVRAIIVKGRKQGCSTYIAGRHYHKVTHRIGFKAFILTHLADATSNLFAMVERFHERNSPFLKPTTGASNKTELLFPAIDGGYGVGTAGSPNVGRSDTIQLFHGSEAAYWPHAEEHASGILQAVPDAAGTEIVLESTTNGPMGFFAEVWKDAVAGKSKYIAIFIPWFWTDEYRSKVPADFEISREEEELASAHGLDDEQVQWRREKINDLKSEDKFRQEYPSTPEEAFQTSGEGCYINPTLVAKARRTKVIVPPYIPIILGVDVARGGRDRSGIIDRQGRKAGGHINEYWDETDATRFAAKLAQVIRRIKPKKVCIDATEGLGGALCDMLNEMGFSSKPGKGQIIVPVKYSESALEDELYENRRAELYAEGLEWLKNPLGVELPAGDDELQGDLCAAIWGAHATRHTRTGRLLLESKDQIIKRLKRSPDKGDALVNTFAAKIIAAKPEQNIILPPTDAVDPAVNY